MYMYMCIYIYIYIPACALQRLLGRVQGDLCRCERLAKSKSDTV